ncbi:MAG: response regulator [Hyphomicrobiales bacterium]|nr:response regulator [Hyphomicrobiales bacterium]
MAQEALGHEKYDLLITDWEMPEMTGLELVQYIRSHPKALNFFVPIIMLTGRAERENIERARDAGITEFLAKPFTIEDLRKRIISVVETPRPFVLSRSYNGPCRRRHNKPPPGGIERRAEE